MVFTYFVIAVLLLLYVLVLGMRVFYKLRFWCVLVFEGRIFVLFRWGIRFQSRSGPGVFGMGVISVWDVVSHCSYL